MSTGFNTAMTLLLIITVFFYVQSLYIGNFLYAACYGGMLLIEFAGTDIVNYLEKKLK